MPRQAILEAPATLYHGMIRGMEGQRILRDTRDRKDFVTRLEDLAKQAATPILASSLLGNQVHGFLSRGYEFSLAQLIQTH